MDFMIMDGIIILTVIITVGSQLYINSTYSKTLKIKNNKNITGAEVARKILDSNGLSNVKILVTKQTLADHYDPRNKTITLSSDVCNGISIASASVAAHECGHAIQDKNGYFFLRFRNGIVPLVNFASSAGYFAILFGVLFGALKLVKIGIVMEAIILLFQLVTLPVEFNASKRALNNLTNLDILDNNEIPKARKMLVAAALTYVAGAVTALLQLLRLILVFGNNRDD